MVKAIIGGTGIYEAGASRPQIVKTKYGQVEVDILNIQGEEIIFLARHGKGHSLPPHLINYRANIWALKELGVKHIYATAAVGSCNENFAPGDIVIIKDFIDFSKSRPNTFFEGGEEGVKHADMSDPYCKNLRKKFLKTAQEKGLEIKGQAVYASTEGPRFETASEIRAYQALGGDVVGMTSVPEVVLAKEAGICYASLGIISNWCTGMEGAITLHDIQGAMEKNRQALTQVFLQVFSQKLDQEACSCNRSIIEL